MEDPNFTAAIVLFLFVIFLPFLVSLFGRMLFGSLSLLCCCLTLYLLVVFFGQPPLVFLVFVSWLGAWTCAAIGINTKRAHRLKLAVGRLYATALAEQHRQGMRGKNRALT